MVRLGFEVRFRWGLSNLSPKMRLSLKMRWEASQEIVSPPAPSAADLRIAELERLLGRKQLEVDFLKRAFEQVRGAASNRTSDGGKESIARSKSRSRSKE